MSENNERWIQAVLVEDHRNPDTFPENAPPAIDASQRMSASGLSELGRRLIAKLGDHLPRTLRAHRAWVLMLVVGGGATGVVGVFLLAVTFVLGASSSRRSEPSMYGPSAYQSPMYPADSSDGYFTGEARVGGMPMTSGTFDGSGAGNHVISVDGEVLNLPPY